MTPTRDRIVDCAFELWSAGVPVTAAGLSAAVGVAPSVLYHHFSDLDAVMDEVFFRAFQGTFRDGILEVADGADVHTVASRFASSAFDLNRLMRLEAMSHYRWRPELARRIRILQREFVERLRPRFGDRAVLVTALAAGLIMAVAEPTDAERALFVDIVVKWAEEENSSKS